ncbi:S9 family peptidase [Phenylobacterium sp. LjRoot225]|uniref:alpha/beta hydrolase family protein n=1 Tax=Phenylobacterium sp. LjRoot225 TaxID=3342285 RepID=UPI003ECE26AC
MFRKVILALGALIASGWSAHAAPLEAYGKLPSIEQAAVSPSGKLVAYVVTDGEERTVAVKHIAAENVVFIGRAGELKLRDLIWAGDDHLVLTMSTARQPYGVITPRVEHAVPLNLDLKTRRIRPLLENPHRVQNAMNTISGTPEVRTIKGKPALFVRGIHFISGQGQPGLFQVDLDSNAATLVAPGGRGAYDWVVGSDGQVLAEALYDDRAGIWGLRVKSSSGTWRTVNKVVAPIETPDLVGLGRDGKSVLVDLADEKGGAAWREMSTETASWGEPIPRSDSQSTILDPDTGRLIGNVALIGDTWKYEFFAPQDTAVWRAVSKAFAGDIVRLVSWSNDRKKIVVRVDSAQLGPAYALVDLNTGKANWLGNEYVGLKAEDVSPVKPVRYKAADGLELTGYLTLPREGAPRGLPLVVLAHGGPAARDEPGFDWWSQALAARGYAVLRVNFRGSDGFGGAFLSAGFGEWGRKMQTDLSDGVRRLAADGVVDPKRVCIVGASYGGYAALAGATIDHGVYRCAAAFGGVADLRDLVTDFRSKRGRVAQRYWLRFIGTDNTADLVMTRYSPAARAAESDIPVLLVHGRDDTVVPIAQSRKMAKALRAVGKPVELIELKGEDHWLSTGETRLAMLQATVDFLEKNNPPN